MAHVSWSYDTRDRQHERRVSQTSFELELKASSILMTSKLSV